jgi:hypothetical protein
MPPSLSSVQFSRSSRPASAPRSAAALRVAVTQILLALLSQRLSAGAQHATAAGAAAAAALPPGSLANYEVRLLSRDVEAELAALPASALAPRNARVTMRSASGAPFTCFVPPAEGAAGGGGGAAAAAEAAAGGAAAAPEEGRAVRARAAAALLASEPGLRCVLRREGYWTFEVCAGQHVRQFHVRPAAPGGRSGGGGGGVEHNDAAPAASTAGAAAELPDDAQRTVVNLLGEHEAGVDAIALSAAGSLVLRQSFAGGADGRRATVSFECDPPGMAPGLHAEILSVAEAPPLQYALLVGTRSAAVCEQLASVRRLLAPLNQTCFEHQEGWWTYEVCAGLRVRQYHAEAGSGKPVQESVIGVFDWQRGAYLQPAGVGTAAALAQHFHLGTPCDIRGGVPREATLRFECSPPLEAGGVAGGAAAGAAAGGVQQLTLISIREAPSCVYTITLGAAAACAHPEVAPNRGVAVVQPPPTQIWCVSDDEDAE